MDSNLRRKEAIKEYKSRKAPRGIFALRCTVTGQVWVDSHPDLEAARNGLWFCLKHASHRNKALQAEWDAHGEQAFQYEILDKLDDDVHPLAVRDLLKERKSHWAAKLGAHTLP